MHYITITRLVIIIVIFLSLLTIASQCSLCNFIRCIASFFSGSLWRQKRDLYYTFWQRFYCYFVTGQWVLRVHRPDVGKTALYRQPRLQRIFSSDGPAHDGPNVSATFSERGHRYAASHDGTRGHSTALSGARHAGPGQWSRRTGVQAGQEDYEETTGWQRSTATHEEVQQNERKQKYSSFTMLIMIILMMIVMIIWRFWHLNPNYRLYIVRMQNSS